MQPPVMTEREGRAVRGLNLVLDRSAVFVLGVLAGIAVLVQPLWGVNPALPSGLVFSAYLGWLACVFAALRTRGRSWARAAYAWAPFGVLFAFALVSLPLQYGETKQGIPDGNWQIATVAAVSYGVIWDHIAISFGRDKSRAVRLSLYVGTMLLALMPPFVIFWVQHHLRTNGTR